MNRATAATGNRRTSGVKSPRSRSYSRNPKETEARPNAERSVKLPERLTAPAELPAKRIPNTNRIAAPTMAISPAGALSKLPKSNCSAPPSPNAVSTASTMVATARATAPKYPSTSTVRGPAARALPLRPAIPSACSKEMCPARTAASCSATNDLPSFGCRQNTQSERTLDRHYPRNASGGCPSGQREQTVNLPATPTEVQILLPPQRGPLAF